jgi:tripeptidyl-peptidase-1
MSPSIKKQPVETFAFAEATIDYVKSWLTDFGIAEESIILSLSRNWLRMDFTIDEAQSLLKTEYTEYEYLTTLK